MVSSNSMLGHILNTKALQLGHGIEIKMPLFSQLVSILITIVLAIVMTSLFRL